MGDPVGAARHVRETLADDGTWMIVEPRGGDRVEENLNPVGRAYYCACTLLCVPASLSQESDSGSASRRARRGSATSSRRWVPALPARGGDALQAGFRGEAVSRTIRHCPLAGGRAAYAFLGAG